MRAFAHWLSRVLWLVIYPFWLAVQVVRISVGAVRDLHEIERAIEEQRRKAARSKDADGTEAR